MCFFRPWRDRVPVGGCVLAELHAQGGREVGRGCPRKPARQIGAPPPFPSLAVARRGRTLQGSPGGPRTPSLSSRPGNSTARKEATCRCSASGTKRAG